MSGPRPEDLPWNDVPADDEALPGTTEPDPAEVVGDALDARDLASPPVRDPNRRESLEERLAEEEPDRPADAASEAEAGALVDRTGDEDDITRAEDDVEDPVEGEALPTEEAAVHLVDDERVL